MKIRILTAIAALFAGHVYAFPLDADFKKPDTAAPDGGWGADWKVEGAPVFLQGGVGKKQSDGQTVVINEKATLPDGAFVLSADVYAQANDRWIGLVFDYQNPEHYTMWRVKFSENSAFEPTPWQLLKYRDGKSSVVQQGTISPGSELTDPAPLKAWRRLEIEREDGDRYTARILSDLETNPATWSTELKWKDGEKGRAGLSFSNGFVWVKAFSAQPPR